MMTIKLEHSHGCFTGRLGKVKRGGVYCLGTFSLCIEDLEMRA
jgi:hypothetical protein